MTMETKICWPKLSEDGWGPAHLLDFAIARKKADEFWAGDDWSRIDAARKEYDAGLVEITSTRDDDWIILYRIPRQKPVKRQDYFGYPMGYFYV